MKPIGIQLYSLREYAAKDFAAVLKKVADIGYKYVEPAGFWDMRPTELKKMVEDLGMGMVSSHSPWARGKANTGECMEIASILGLNKIVCGYGPDDFKDLDAIKKTADITNEMCEIFNHLLEFGGTQIPEPGRFNILVANVSDFLQNSHKIFCGIFPQRIQLDPDGFHLFFPFFCFFYVLLHRFKR